MIETKKVPNRRTLRFDTVNDIRADAESISEHTHTALGNWSIGQIFAHVAIGMELCTDGYGDLKFPFLMRLIGPRLLPGILKNGMKPGLKFDKRLAPVFTPPGCTFGEGFERLRAAIERMNTTEYRHPSPFFGKLTRDEYEQFHCRHAEMHLSFIASK